MSEEQTQVFRGDEAPEMAIAETGGPVRKKPIDAPIDSRGLQDQKDGPSLSRAIGGAAGGGGEQRRMDDADGLAELRQLHDAEGLSDQRALHDASHGGDSATARDGDGPSDVRRMEDADGLSDQRRMEDADGLSDQRRLQDAEGLSERRELHDHHAALPGAGDGEQALAGDEVAGQAEVAAEAVMSDPDLTFKVEEDATPWALSIHLEERIASLGVTTAKVNEQLHGLEDSIRRLAKRIGR